MQFRLDDDQLAMRDAVRAVCTGEVTWSVLADLGVLGMLEPGSGSGVVEAAVVCEELGAHLVEGPVLWTVLAGSLVPDAEKVAGVEAVDGPAVIDHGLESDAIVVLHADRVERCTPDLEPGEPLDPKTPVAIARQLPAGDVVGGRDEARRLRRDGTILAAAMLVGTARGALETARAYALEREQFGVPIGSFQAIKHLLADMYVRVELARASTYAAAAIAACRGAGDDEQAAARAKLLAGEAGIANGRAAVQVLGGMGFTWDMLPHYFLKRSWSLENSFGTSSAHALQLATLVAP